MASALRGASLFVALGIVTAYLDWFPQVAWSIAGFFAVIAAIEFLMLRSNMKRADSDD